MSKAESRAGIYYWAGPGTIRMIKLKYFSPPIAEEQLLRAYDADVLAGLQRALGTTDAWATYSWGFSDALEAEDRAFLRSKIANFKRLGMRVHAYVQGTNLVLADREDDPWCRDHRGRLIPYHRGRKLCCPLNPAFRRVLLERVEAACKEEVDGVFVDNFHFGQMPIPVGDGLSFHGCACQYCAAAFRRHSGAAIPQSHNADNGLSQAYTAFRVGVMRQLSKELRALTAAHGKQFGVNGLDADLNTEQFYGYSLQDLMCNQDYLLVENFNHPLVGRSNASLKHTIDASPVPVFIVSYRRTIGRHSASTQADIDAIAAEARALGYAPCFKASEFTTDGQWHNLDHEGIEEPREYAIDHSAATAEVSLRGLPRSRFLLFLVNRWMTPFLTATYESLAFRKLFGWMVDAATMRRLPWK